MPNLSQDTDILNIHCDLINDSLVDGEDTDIIFIPSQPVCFNLVTHLQSNRKESHLILLTRTV